MKLAVIDCGTNTFNLLIFDYQSEGSFKKIFSTRKSVKLGQNSFDKNIQPDALERAFDTFKYFFSEIKKVKAQKVIAYGTSAIRDADNGYLLTDKVKKLYKLEIEIINGLQEADLIYLGVKHAVALGSKKKLIMDIGGGSVEFIIANDSKIFWKQSYNIGVARLLEQFKPSNPISTFEILDVRRFFTHQLQALIKAVQKNKITELIGSSGAFESFVEILYEKYGGENLNENQTEYLLNMENYLELSQKIIKSKTTDRRKMKGLIAMRVDMIVLTCLLLDFVIYACNIEQLKVSTYSLKEGAFYNYLNKLDS